MARFVLDTNTISQILRRNATALAHLREAADNDDDLFLCPVVFYELWRGLRYVGNSRRVHPHSKGPDKFVFIGRTGPPFYGADLRCALCELDLNSHDSDGSLVPSEKPLHCTIGDTRRTVDRQPKSIRDLPRERLLPERV